MKSKKVLFIAGLFPPIANSGTQRSAKFARYLPEYGWQPIVLTSKGSGLPEDERLMAEVDPQTEIIRLPFLSDVLAARCSKLTRAFLDPAKVTEGLSWRIANLWKIPDEWVWWQYMVVKYAKQRFHEDPYDCIYATGFPWSSFLAADRISKTLGIPYVVDFRDLWTDWDLSGSQIPWLKKSLSVKQERKVLKNADAVIAVSDTQMGILKQRTSRSHSDCFFTITNGFDAEDFRGIKDDRNSFEKFRIVYTGVWKDGYSPEDLYRAVDQIRILNPEVFNRLEIVCAGFSPKLCLYPQLHPILTEHDRVSHKDALGLMSGADALFLPVADGSYAFGHIPGKLFEYLGAGAPVLAVAPKGSEVDKVLDLVKAGIVTEPGNIKSLISGIIACVNTKINDLIEPNVDGIACFERRTLTAHLGEVFDFVIGGRRGND